MSEMFEAGRGARPGGTTAPDPRTHQAAPGTAEHRAGARQGGAAQ